MKAEFKGALFLFLAAFLFSLVAVFVKFLSKYFNIVFISFIFFFFSNLGGFIMLKIKKQKFKINNFKFWFLRGFVGSITMLIYFYSIKLSGSGRSTLLFNTAPMFIVFINYFLFTKKLNFIDILKSIICFIGVYIVINDKSSHNLYADIIGIFSGVMLAFTTIFIRKSSEYNSPLVVTFSFSIFGSLFSSYSLFNPEINNINYIFLLIIIGLINYSGQVIMSYAYKFISVEKGSLISYLGIPMTILFSIFNNETINSQFILGTIVIILGLNINFIYNLKK